MYHKDEKKKDNKIITIILVMILFIIVFIAQSLFISGPKYFYENKIKEEMTLIKSKYNQDLKLSRHVFQYITYIGENNDEYLWFNQEGSLLTKRAKNTIQYEQVKQILKQYGINEEMITLGYGYDNPVYVVSNDQVELLLDYDTLKEVYYLKKG